MRVLILISLLASSPLWASDKAAELDGLFFLKLLAESDAGVQRGMLRQIRSKWHDSYVPILLEAGNFTPDQRLKRQVFSLLSEATGREFTGNLDEWYVWWWRKERPQHPDYANFKAGLFANIDRSFGAYFNNERPTTIRLDEVRWGGVVRDGIPPLHNPRMIAAEQATYLGKKDIVFGIEVEGDVRAYPKRILGWHEMFTDTVGGVPICGVYCTLCGTVIIYETEIADTRHEMGTSGFLYRSNKLMYDKATFSLWNTIWGEPVIGPLVGEGIVLERRSVVTTTWGAWKKRHPNTTVLSLDTGYERDYGEGVAYKEYFSNDKLMFGVPKRDRRLRNKAEVLGLVFPEDREQTMAISVRFLKKRPLYTETLAGIDFVVFTDDSGASRVYRRGEVAFSSYDGLRARDEQGGVWAVEEHGLISPAGTVLERLPAHRAFWFGWYSAYPDTRLVK